MERKMGTLLKVFGPTVIGFVAGAMSFHFAMTLPERQALSIALLTCSIVTRAIMFIFTRLY